MIWWVVIVALVAIIAFLFGIGVGLIWFGAGLNMHLKTHDMVRVGDNWGWQERTEL